MAINQSTHFPKRRNDLAAEFVRQILHYNPHSGIFTWNYRSDVQQNWNAKFPGKIAGNYHSKSGYHRISINNARYRSNRLAWLYMTGAWPINEIDHIDLDLAMEKQSLRDAETRLAAYRPRVGQSFPLADELAEKQAALLELDAELAATASIVNEGAPAGGAEPADAIPENHEPEPEREAA